MSIVKKPDDTTVIMEGNSDGVAYVEGKGQLDWAVLVKDDLAATEAFVLVDLSDTTNFPHASTAKLVLYHLSIWGELKTSGQYVVTIGVISEVDATDGTAEWIWYLNSETDEQATDGIRQFHVEFNYPWGMDLVVASDALTNVVTNSELAADVTWQTDVSLDSPVGDASSPPGAGDLVALVEETTGGGTISLHILVGYRAE